MISRQELKMTAKMRLSQADPGYIKVIIVYILAAVVMPQVVLTVISPSTELMNQMYELISNGFDPETVFQLLPISPLQGLLQQALNVVLQMYQILMVFGLTRYCLSLYRGEPCGPADLFVGFSMVGRVLAERILIGLIVFGIVFVMIFAAGFAGGMLFVFLPDDLAPVLMGLLFCVIFAVVIYAMLNFALSTLALADRPELGAMGAIQYSKILMRGHKKQYFVLSLSFFGWSLLCSIPMGIFMSHEVFQMLGNMGGALSFAGALPDWADSLIMMVLSLPIYLWLTPYMNTTIAGFYDSLHNQGFRPLDPNPSEWHP